MQVSEVSTHLCWSVRTTSFEMINAAPLVQDAQHRLIQEACETLNTGFSYSAFLRIPCSYGCHVLRDDDFPKALWSLVSLPCSHGDRRLFHVFMRMWAPFSNLQERRQRSRQNVVS